MDNTIVDCFFRLSVH